MVSPDGSWLASAGIYGEVRIWDPTTGTPLTSLRVAGSIFHLALASTTIAAAGECGVYFLTLYCGVQSALMPLWMSRAEGCVSGGAVMIW
jgi:hypothetical protein